jgi:GT2 family glycosyltransferase
MQSETSISVVIPTHKTRERTLRCLAALWLCNPQPDEVIVVDDGSEDNTAYSVLRKYPRHIVVRLPTPQGFAAAVNHGVARASGDLLFLLDNRTEVDPPVVGAIRRIFEMREDLGIAGAALKDSNGEAQWSGGRIPGTLWCFALASGLPSLLDRSKVWRRLRAITRPRRGPVDWVSGAAMVVRRQLWAEIGPFDAGYQLRGQYLDLCVKAAEAGWKVEIVPEFTAVHPANGSEPSTSYGAELFNEELMWSDLLRFADKRNGDTGARQSGRALRMGGRLRVIGRHMAAPLVAKDHQEEWRAETDAYAETLRTLTNASREERQTPGRAAR